MRRRVEQSLPAGQAGRELKLGPGGLRDIEFTVQLLQLVHGRADETLRSPATLPALAALADGGYVGRDDAAALADAYRFLRRVEHLLQLYQLRRTHSLPDDPQTIRRIGRAMHQPFLPNGPGPARRGRPPTPRRNSPPSGGGTRSRSGGCTRSSSTARCCTRPRGCRVRRPA